MNKLIAKAVIGTAITIEKRITNELHKTHTYHNEYISSITFATDEDGYIRLPFDRGDVTPQNLGDRAELII